MAGSSSAANPLFAELMHLLDGFFLLVAGFRLPLADWFLFLFVSEGFFGP
jgi:hypothetical protein